MKVLLYPTKAKPRLSVVHDDENGKTYYYLDSNWGKELNGKVVASFELDRVDLYNPFYFENTGIRKFDYLVDWETKEKLCLEDEDINEYGQGKDIYAWHIDNLQVFDEPIELGELYSDWDIFDTDSNGKYVGKYVQPISFVTKAPRSYQCVYYKGEKCLLLSVKAQDVYDIIQERKTVLIRKSKPKEVR